jgi:hypothetical protein
MRHTAPATRTLLALLLALGAVPAGAIELFALQFAPAAPMPADRVSVAFSADVSCRNVTFAAPTVVPTGLHVVGTAGLDQPCPAGQPPTAFEVELGQLAPGLYDVSVSLVFSEDQGGEIFARGNGTLAVQAPGGTDQPLGLRTSPALPTAGDEIAVDFVAHLGCNELVFGPAVVEGDRVLLAGTYLGEEDCPTSAARAVTVPLAPLPPGDYRLVVELSHEGSAAPFASGEHALHVEPASQRLVLRAGQSTFDLAVTWSSPHAGSGTGRPVRLGERSGYFWFFDDELVEVTAKIIDGSAVNGHFWLFLASMTDVEVVVTVSRFTGSYCLDTQTCPTRVYTLAPGQVVGVADLEVF